MDIRAWLYRLKLFGHAPVWARIPGPYTQNRVPGCGIPGSIRIMGQVTYFCKTYSIYIIAIFFYIHQLYWHHHCAAAVILCQKEVMSSSWKWWPVVRGTAHHPLLRQLLLVHSMTLTAENGIKTPIQEVLLELSCLFPIGDFTKYGQPVSRTDPGFGIAHFQLWGWRYPSRAQTVPFSSAWIYFPNSNHLVQSMRLIYVPLA